MPECQWPSKRWLQTPAFHANPDSDLGQSKGAPRADFLPFAFGLQAYLAVVPKQRLMCIKAVRSHAVFCVSALQENGI